MASAAPDGHHIDLVLFDVGGTLVYQEGDWSSMVRDMNHRLAVSVMKAGYTIDIDRFAADHHALVEAYFRSRNLDLSERTACSLLAETLAGYGYPNIEPSTLQAHIDAMFSISQSYYHAELDAAPLLDHLLRSGFRLGVISNASDVHDVHTLLENAQLKDYFEYILVSAGVGIRKPSAVIFQHALDHFDALPSQAVMVGDTLNADILGAENAGIRSVWITRRADNLENQALQANIIPDAKIKTFSELPELLERWNAL